jgi:hypothetical protein
MGLVAFGPRKSVFLGRVVDGKHDVDSKSLKPSSAVPLVSTKHAAFSRCGSLLFTLDPSRK